MTKLETPDERTCELIDCNRPVVDMLTSVSL